MTIAQRQAGVTAVPDTPSTAAAAQVRRLKPVLALDDFEPAARRFLPRSVFGYIAGGVETDWSLRPNRSAFARWAFVPRMLVDTSARTTKRELFGHTYDAPFGIAPMGASGLAGFHADIAYARAAAAANIPFLLSGASIVTLERVAAPPIQPPGSRPTCRPTATRSVRCSIACAPPGTKPWWSRPTCRSVAIARTTSATAIRRLYGRPCSSRSTH